MDIALQPDGSIPGYAQLVCMGSFLKRLGTNDISEIPYVILPAPDQNFIIGGQYENRSLLSLITPEGEVLWSRTFDFMPGQDFVWRMTLDSEGMLVATGRDQLLTNSINYIFRYDYVNDQILWSKLFLQPDYKLMEGILEKTPGGNYLVFGMLSNGQNDNFLMEIDRETGEPVWMKLYDFGTTDYFLSGQIYQGEIYLTGVNRSGGLDKIRAAITKLDLSGNQLWTRFYYNPIPDMARTYMYDLWIENDTIVAFSIGDFNGSSLTEVEFHLLKTDLDGQAYWAKSYNIPGSSSETIHKMISLPDGYILHGSHLTGGESEFFFIRVNKAGNVLWSKSVSSIDGAWGPNVVLHEGFLVFVGKSTAFDPAESDIMLGKMSLDGNISNGECIAVSDIDVNMLDIANPYDGQHNLGQSDISFSLNSVNKSPLAVSIPFEDIPSCECQEVTDPCDSSSLVINFETMPACPDFFDGEITAIIEGTHPPFSFQWSAGTSDTNVLTSLNAGSYSLTVTDANGCTSTAVAVVEFLEQPAITGEVSHITCHGANDGAVTVTEYDPSLQFSFFGSDFSDQTEYENIFPGNWQLFVLDTFGCVWEEFFTVTQPAPVFLQLPADVTIEAGDTFEINPVTLQNDLVFNWLPDSTLDCADCPFPIAQPEITTLYTLTVTDTNGCQTADSILISVTSELAVYVPNVFSPNGDGINDNFYLFGDGIAEVQLLRIFDRWGEMVFEKTNFPANDPLFGWDGRFKGKPANPDVFAYYVVLRFIDGSEKTIKGDLTLLR